MYTRDDIHALLDSNNSVVEQAILAIYNRQTEDEKATNTTRVNNGMGFNYHDAGIGGYYARWILSGRKLSGKHLVHARRMGHKYVRQLVELANSNHADHGKQLLLGG